MCLTSSQCSSAVGLLEETLLLLELQSLLRGKSVFTAWANEFINNKHLHYRKQLTWHTSPVNDVHIHQFCNTFHTPFFIYWYLHAADTIVCPDSLTWHNSCAQCSRWFWKHQFILSPCSSYAQVYTGVHTLPPSHLLQWVFHEATTESIARSFFVFFFFRSLNALVASVKSDTSSRASISRCRKLSPARL